jgi:uncharacterized membrane protein
MTSYLYHFFAPLTTYSDDLHYLMSPHLHYLIITFFIPIAPGLLRLLLVLLLQLPLPGMMIPLSPT